MTPRDVKNLHDEACGAMNRVLAAYGSQRDKINDSDLDAEQPITLTVYLTLGHVSAMRNMVRHEGHIPAECRGNDEPAR